MIPLTLHAEFYDGNKLYQICQKNQNACRAYIAGAFDSLDYEDFISHDDIQRVKIQIEKDNIGNATDGVEIDKFSLGSRNREKCLPKDLTLEQASDIVFHYLKRNPKIREHSASLLTKHALTHNFCPEHSPHPILDFVSKYKINTRQNH